MATTITINDNLLPDLKLVKRVSGKSSMTDTIRFIMDRAGYNERWLEYIESLLASEGSEE